MLRRTLSIAMDVESYPNGCANGDAVDDALQFCFGHREEWRAFAERNPAFLHRFVNLRAALDKAFVRSVPSPEKLDSVIFATSLQCLDDFMEILLLCGNAEGYGAEKILRSFFERIVLTKYLHLNPATLDDYYDYYHVSVRKLIKAQIAIWGPQSLDPTKVQVALEDFEHVKKRYGKMSWTPLRFAEMARAVGLERFLFHAYELPLQQIHPSVKGTLSRFENDETGGINYGDRLNRQKADEVLAVAHVLLIYLLGVQVKHFQVDGLEAMARQAELDYVEIWNGHSATQITDREPSAQ